MSADFPLSCEYTVSEAEFVQGHRAHLRRLLLNGKNLVLISMALGLGAIQAQIFGGAQTVLRVFMLLWAMTIAALILAYTYLPRRTYRASARHSQPHSLRLDENQVVVRRGNHELALPWERITSLNDAGPSLLLYPKGHIPIVVPKRAFADSAAQERFEKAVLGRLGL
jgi:hypothetical protein